MTENVFKACQHLFFPHDNQQMISFSHTAFQALGRGSLQLCQVLLQQGEAVPDLSGSSGQGGHGLLHSGDRQRDLLGLQPVAAVRVEGGVGRSAVVVGGGNSGPKAVHGGRRRSRD